MVIRSLNASLSVSVCYPVMNENILKYPVHLKTFDVILIPVTLAFEQYKIMLTTTQKPVETKVIKCLLKVRPFAATRR